MNRIGRRTAYCHACHLGGGASLARDGIAVGSLHCVIAHGIEKGRIGATLGRLNLNGMKSSPGKSHPTVFHRPRVSAGIRRSDTRNQMGVLMNGPDAGAGGRRGRRLTTHALKTERSLPYRW